MSLDVYLMTDDEVVFTHTITHNLSNMAAAIGVFTYVWRPESLGITKASELMMPLINSLQTLCGNPELYIKLNPKNGWGNYDNLVGFLEHYIIACIKYPNAKIEVSR